MLSKSAVTLIFNEKQQDCQGISDHNFSSSDKTIDRLENVSYEKFFTEYLIKNIPCIISLEKVKTWKSSMEWKVDEKPNFEFLEQMFGSSNVPIADCNVKEYNSQKKKSMLFKDYIEYWHNLNEDEKSELLYLKDWHFKRQVFDYFKSMSSENI